MRLPAEGNGQCQIHETTIEVVVVELCTESPRPKTTPALVPPKTVAPGSFVWKRVVGICGWLINSNV